MVAGEVTTCSHPDCPKTVPPENKIPEGWTHALVEVFGTSAITYYHLYLCPFHVLTSDDKQSNLFGDSGAK